MEKEISKTQFVVLSIIIIVITIVLIVIITNNKGNDASNLVNNNASPSQIVITNPSNNTSNVEEEATNNPIINSEEEENTIPENNENVNENVGGSIKDTNDINNNTESIFPELQKKIERTLSQKDEIIFTNMFTVPKEDIENNMGIDLTNYSDYLVRMSNNRFNSEMYMIFKPILEKKEKGKEEIKAFMLSYEKAWENLNEEQYKLVKERTQVERNGYLIYIVSVDNNTVMNIIREKI